MAHKRRRGGKTETGQVANGQDLEVRLKDPQGTRSENKILSRDIVSTGRQVRAIPLLGFTESRAMMAKGVLFFIYHVVMPKISTAALRVFAHQALVSIESSDESRQKWYFEKRYKLDLTVGKVPYDVDSRVNALTFNLQNYLRRATPFLMYLGTAVLLLSLRGGFNFITRVTNALKWSGLNSIFSHIGPIPFNSVLYRALVSRLQILVKRAPDGQEGVFIPMPMKYGVTDPLFNSLVTVTSTGVRTNTKALIKLSMSNDHTTGALGIPGPVGSINQMLNNISISGITNADLASDDLNEAWWGDGSDSPFRDGKIVGSLKNGITRSRDILIREYRDTILDPASQQFEFYSEANMGALDMMVTLEQLAHDVRANKYGSADDYSEKFMRYRSINLPPSSASNSLHEYHQGIIDRFVDADGRIGKEEDLAIEPYSYLKTDLARAMDFVQALEALPSTDFDTPVIKMSTAMTIAMSKADLNRPFLYTRDPSEQQKLRSWTSTLRSAGNLFKPADVLTLFHEFQNITWDWSKWFIGGYDEEYGDDPLLLGSSGLIGAIERGKHSLTLEKGVVPAWKGLIDNTFGNAKFPVHGVSAVVLSYLEALSSSIVFFALNEAEAVEKFSRSTGDKASPYFLADDFDQGVIAIRTYNDPRCDNTTPLNCGYYKINSIETVNASTPTRQLDQFAWYARKGRRTKHSAVSWLPSTLGEVLFEPFSEHSGTDVAAKIKDDLLFVGNAAMMSVVQAFSRHEIHPIPIRIRTATDILTGNLTPIMTHFVGIDYPVGIYTFKHNQDPSSLTIVPHIQGSEFKKSILTAETWPAKTAISATLADFNIGQAGFSRVLDRLQLSWMDFIPILVPDSSRPYPFAFDNVMYSLLDASAAIVTAVDYKVLLPLGLEITPITEGVIGEATKRVLILSNEQVNVKVPEIRDSKDFKRPPRDRGDKRFKHPRARTAGVKSVTDIAAANALETVAAPAVGKPEPVKAKLDSSITT